VKYAEITAVKGVRNDVGPERFSSGDLAYARNLDIDETGKAMRRLGTSLLYAGAAHSAWGDKSQAFFVQGGYLKRFAPGVAPANLAPVAGTRVAYAAINDTVYWSDSLTSGAVTNGVNRKWGITVPTTPALAAAAGNLRAGTYLCTMTYVTHSGVESGAPQSGSITLAANGGISFSNLSVSDDSNVLSKNIYLSACDGDVPLLTITLPNATADTTITEMSQQTVPVRTQFLGPPPAGQVVGHYNGRAYVASGQFLHYSLPFEYGLFDLRSGFIPLGADIQTFAAVTDGIFVGTTARTVFLKGSAPEEFVRVPVASFGAVLGTEVEVDADTIGAEEISGSQIAGNAVMWTSAKGVVVGMDGGSVRDLTAGGYITPLGLKTGGALLKLRSGTPQYVVSLFS
jgi:hypothetical protein